MCLLPVDFEQLAGFGFRILRIGRFDHQEKAVMRRAGEACALEQRMIQPRQPIQEQHAEDGTERA